MRVLVWVAEYGILAPISRNEAYSAAGKIRLRQQVEDQKEHAI